ncbi:MAG: hypothetical protein QW076_01060 [Candidatus Anstonellales archaeon]
MARRKDLLSELLEVIIGPYLGVLLLFGFFNKSIFWKMLIGGCIFLGVIFAVLLVKQGKIHKQSQWQTDRELERYLLGL